MKKTKFQLISEKHHKVVKEQTDGYQTTANDYQGFIRSFDVTNVEIDQITADYRQGLLRLSLPKKEPSKTSTKKIEL